MYQNGLIIYDKYMYTHERIMTPIMIGYKVPTSRSIEFRSKLGLDQNKMILTKEQSVLILTLDAFKGEKNANSIQCLRL